MNSQQPNLLLQQSWPASSDQDSLAHRLAHTAYWRLRGTRDHAHDWGLWDPVCERWLQ